MTFITRKEKLWLAAAAIGAFLLTGCTAFSNSHGNMQRYGDVQLQGAAPLYGGCDQACMAMLYQQPMGGVAVQQAGYAIAGQPGYAALGQPGYAVAAQAAYGQPAVQSIQYGTATTAAMAAPGYAVMAQPAAVQYEMATTGAAVSTTAAGLTYAYQAPGMPADCPAGTTPQADGTCLMQGGSYAQSQSYTQVQTPTHNIITQPYVPQNTGYVPVPPKPGHTFMPVRK